MLPAAVVQPTLDQLRAAARRRRHRDRRRQLLLPRRHHPRRSSSQATGIHYVDCGTSGGVWGLDRGYCLMIGGEDGPVRAARPDLQDHRARARGAPSPRRAGPARTAPRPTGYLHCGPNGAGHFVKMVHNGIEYGMMAAIAEGLSIIKHADAGLHQREVDAETTPLRDPEAYQYEIDVAEVAEVWRRGSVVGSWLVDLTADALAQSPDLDEFAGRVSDSGEGRWTVLAAVDEGVPGLGHHRLAERALRVPRPRRVHRQDPLGHAQRVRRPRREAGLSRCSPSSRCSPTRTPWPEPRPRLRGGAARAAAGGGRPVHASRSAAGTRRGRCSRSWRGRTCRGSRW